MTVDKILEFLMEHEGEYFSSREISEQCGVTTKYVTIYLNRLVKYYKDEIDIKPSDEPQHGRYMRMWSYKKCESNE